MDQTGELMMTSDPVAAAYRAGLAEMQGRCRVIAENVAAESRLARRMTGADLSEQERTAERIAGEIGKLKV